MDIPLIVARVPIKDRVTIWTKVKVRRVAMITSGAYPIYGESAQDEASSDRNPIEMNSEGVVVKEVLVIPPIKFLLFDLIEK